MGPESRIAADKAASRRADEVIETEAPPKPGRAEPPPPRGSLGAGGATAKSAELAEVEAKLTEAKAQLKQAANDAGVELPKPKEGEKDPTARAQDYQRAWQAIAVCARGKGL